MKESAVSLTTGSAAFSRRNKLFMAIGIGCFWLKGSVNFVED